METNRMKKLVAVLIAATMGSAFAFPFSDTINVVNNLQVWSDCALDSHYTVNWTNWWGGNWHVQGVVHPDSGCPGCYSITINGSVSDPSIQGTYDLTNFEYWLPELAVCNGQTTFPDNLYYNFFETRIPMF